MMPVRSMRETEKSGGRPRSSSKRQKILAAAREAFLEYGYTDASMDLVAERAGVSKVTVYSHFGSKEELLSAVIDVRAQELFAQIGGLEAPSDDVRGDLVAFGVAFTEFALVGTARKWDRLAIAEAGRQPELAQKLFTAGPSKVLGLVESYLKSQQEAGRLDVDDPSLAAEHLLGLIVGLELFRGQLASLPNRSRQQREARVHRAVDVFLAAYGKRLVERQ